MNNDVKRIDIKEFRKLGFLQEVNRLFFHPLGMALEVIVETDGTEHLGGIWDYRDDPEGIIYEEANPPTYERSKETKRLSESKIQTRLNKFGWIVQPLSYGKGMEVIELGKGTIIFNGVEFECESMNLEVEKTESGMPVLCDITKQFPIKDSPCECDACKLYKVLSKQYKETKA